MSIYDLLVKYFHHSDTGIRADRAYELLITLQNVTLIWYLLFILYRLTLHYITTFYVVLLI